jgi:RNA polymerase sigma-70 factor (ECF subfamily)
MTLSDTYHGSDRELVNRYLRTRDETTFRTLYRRHTPRLFAMALRLLNGSGEDAEDVIQEAWITATRRLAIFRWESTLATWLSGIVLNSARNRYRRNAMALGELADIAEIPAPSPIGGSIDAIDMERALGRLPDGYREVLLLHDAMGFRHKDVASVLGIAEGTSKSQLARARSAMRRLLTGTGERSHERRSE